MFLQEDNMDTGETPLKNIRHEAFVQQMLLGVLENKKPYQVYKELFHTVSTVSAKTIAGQILKRPEVMKRMEYLQKQSEEKYEDLRSRVLDRLSLILDKGADRDSINAGRLIGDFMGWTQTSKLKLEAEIKAPIQPVFASEDGTLPDGEVTE